MSEAEILFERRGALGLVTLNRPKALNALTLGMVDAMTGQLRVWAHDAAVKRVAVIGAGERAFCAGGDIRALYDSGKAGTPYALDFWRREYQLDTLIKRYPKPYVALLNGITMGGGVGVAVHGSLRVACEATVFAMPETGIGLFPDVGGTYFLPRLPGELGVFLALTCTRLKAGDLVACRLADCFVPRARFDDVIAALATGHDTDARAIVEPFTVPAEPGEVSAKTAEIDRLFGHGSVEAIVEALAHARGAWAAEQRQIILAKSPTSLKVAFRQICEGGQLSFEECMKLEYRLTTRFIAGHDFFEGVRATILDKDQAPKWDPARLEDVRDAEIARYFAPIAGELELPAGD
ncbi:MAG: enoyl-CoA hydratase/isomerase family protein [Alphaproteobacteria bacterium]|nr:enoyl-CoA hydratase/isomerase family protein [Alphaproteobacteria bacterium]